MVLSDVILVPWCKIQNFCCPTNLLYEFATELGFGDYFQDGNPGIVEQNGAGNLLVQVEQHVIILLNFFFV